MQARIWEKREEHAKELEESVAMAITSQAPLQCNTTAQKRISGLIKEIWS